MHEPGKTRIIAGYALQQRLGSGSFATVYKGVKVEQNDDGKGPKEVAIKAITRNSDKLTKKVLENLELEISIMRTYRHPNIVCLQDVQKTERHFYLILEFCGGGDLQQLIRTRKAGRLSEPLVRRLMRDLSAGLRFLWGQELIHRDIKPQNLLLTGPLPLDEVSDPAKIDAHDEMRRRVNFPSSQFALKIADFGFARHLQTASLAETLCGSPLYMAPEILQHHRYDAKADLWSVGTVLFEMIAGRPPFNGENHIDLLRNIQRKAVRLPADVRVSKECVNLLRILLNRNPLSRAGFKEFVEACDAFVALGCKGQAQSGATTPVAQQPMKMDLGTIHEVDPHGTASMMTVATAMPGVATPAPVSVPRTSPIKQFTPPQQASPPGFITPPFGPLHSPSPPTEISPGKQMVSAAQQGLRYTPGQQRFTPLQPSPPPPTTYYPARQMPNIPPLNAVASPPPNNWSQDQTSQSSNPSSQHSSDNESGSFVMVEHRSAQLSGTLSPAAAPQTSTSWSDRKPSHVSRLASILPTVTTSKPATYSERSPTVPKGMLSTSPGTGLAFLGLTNRLLQQYPSGALTPDRFEAQVKSLTKMVATAEDVGRRAISVAHLGDTRAYIAMRLYVGNGAGSSLLTSTAMEGVEEEKDDEHSSANVTDCESEATDVAGRRRSVSFTDRSMASAKHDDENDEMPFAVTEETPKKKNTTIAPFTTRDSVSASSSIYKRSMTKAKPPMKASPEMIRSRFSEALSCYLKSLSMLKSVLGIMQKVKSDIVACTPSTPEMQSTIGALSKRCDVTATWLTGQFTGVLERADAANVEVSKLSGASEKPAPVTSVEELIYNHALACGRDGAVKQLLGQHDAARSCYRSAGLLAETLLMEPSVGNDDRKVLEGYVDGFAERITELDEIMMQQSRSLTSSPGSSFGMSRRGSGVIGLIGGIPPPPAGFDAVSTAFRFSSSASNNM